MAARKTIVYVGSSNCRGLGTSILQVPSDAFGRWFGFGQSLATIGQGAAYLDPGQGFPWLAEMQDVLMWTPRLPYMAETVRDIASGDFSGTTLDYTGGYVDTADADSWVFIAKNVSPGGQGNFRKVVSNVEDGGGAGVHRITVNLAWSPAVVGGSGGVLSFFNDSHCVGSIDADRKVITKSGGTPNFPAIPAGTIVVFRLSNGIGPTSDNASRKVIAATATTITLDYKLGDGSVEAGDGMLLLLGVDACSNIVDLANPNNADMVRLGIRVDTSPCFHGDGTAYSNIHNQPGLGPSDLTSNAVYQLMRLFRERFSETLYGITMGRDSATLAPYPITQNNISLTPLYAMWQKDLTDLSFNPAVPFTGLYAAMFSALTSAGLMALAENDTMEVEAFVILLAENDAQFDVTIDQIGQHMRTLRNVVRAVLNQPTMKWIMVGPSSIVWLPRREEVYAQLQAIVDEDPYAGLVDTRDGMTYVVGENPPVHMDTVSQIELANRIYATYEEVADRAGVLIDNATFVVEDGQALIEANSFCSVEFADAYLQDYEDPTDWRAATDKRKKDALRRMSRWVSQRKRYLGQKVEFDQGLAFPRFGLCDEDGYYIPSDSVPLRIKQATAYGAWRIVAGTWDPFPDEEQNAGLMSSDIAVGPIRISESYAGARNSPNTETKLPVVDQLLSIFVVPSTVTRLGRS